FEIELVGSGAHGARPHEAADPIVGAAALIGALQTIVARRVNPAYPAVVSVGSVRAGSAPNVIPDRATLTGTLRATDPDTRRLLVEEVLRIGAREPGGEPIPAHSPRFYAAEESIFVGAAVLAETARIASEAVS